MPLVKSVRQKGRKLPFCPWIFSSARDTCRVPIGALTDRFDRSGAPPLAGGTGRLDNFLSREASGHFSRRRAMALGSGGGLAAAPRRFTLHPARSFPVSDESPACGLGKLFRRPCFRFQPRTSFPLPVRFRFRFA